MSYTLTPGQINELVSELDENYDDVIRSDYSGRGMYDDTCLGYTGEFPTRFALLRANAIGTDGSSVVALNVDELLDQLTDLGEPRTDSLGLGTITYWPSVRIAVHA